MPGHYFSAGIGTNQVVRGNRLDFCKKLSNGRSSIKGLECRRRTHVKGKERFVKPPYIANIDN